MLIILIRDIKACPSEDTYCTSCVIVNDIQYRCQSCLKAFLNPTTFKCEEPVSKIGNCNTYENDGVCSSCGTGYFLESPVSCLKIAIRGCNFSTSENTCVICGGGTKVVNDVCNTENKCPQNCSDCFKNGDCLVCNRKYHLDANKCVKSENNLKNCIRKRSGTENCDLCWPNYYWDNGACTNSSDYEVNLKSIKILNFGILAFFLFLINNK